MWVCVLLKPGVRILSVASMTSVLVGSGEVTDGAMAVIVESVVRREWSWSVSREDVEGLKVMMVAFRKRMCFGEVIVADGMLVNGSNRRTG